MPTTFSTIYTAVANRARIPTDDSTRLTRIKQLINDKYRDICLQEDWYWLIKRFVVNTASAFDHGTITMVTGSANFTLSNVATALGSFVNRKLHIPSGTPDTLATYRIATHVASEATGVLDAAFTSTSTTGATFKIWQDEYDLPTDFLSLVDLERWGFELPARPIGPRDMLLLKGRDTTEGRPQRYTVLDFDTTGDPTTQRQLVVHPYPDHLYRIEVSYRRQATSLVSDEDQPAMPEEFRHVLTEGALADVYTVMLNDESRGNTYQQRYEQGVARMAAQHREVTGQKSGIAPKDQYRGHFKGRRISPGTMDLGSWFDRWGTRW